MVVEEEEGEGGECDRVSWGTREELILGGAILRHGYYDWDVVALELQTRTSYPFIFTPQMCQAKYEDLQERYSGPSWFEDLRSRRVQELRRALEKSEDSIGSLQSRLESLKSDKQVRDKVDYSSNREESPMFLASEGNGSSDKDISRDGLSAGSFTQETQTNWEAPYKSAHKSSAECVKREHAKLSRLEKFSSIDKLEETIRSKGGVGIRKRRGQRRINDFIKDAKEGSVGENNLVCSTALLNTPPLKETMASDCGHTIIRIDGANDQTPHTSKQGVDDFTNILDSIKENEHAIVFRRRLDSQKRARYRKIIRQHIDLDTVRARITKKSITSMVELLRDLLLIANNALVFYSKSTREYKCALVLRNLVNERVHQYQRSNNYSKNVFVETPKSLVTRRLSRRPAKPRSARPCISKLGNKVGENVENVSSDLAGKVGKHTLGNEVNSPSSAESSSVTKRSDGKKGKVERVSRGNVGIQGETLMKVRKKVRVK